MFPINPSFIKSVGLFDSLLICGVVTWHGTRMDMVAANSRVTVSTSGTGAKLCGVDRKAGVRLGHSRVVVEISGRVGTIYTLTSFPVASISFT